MTLSPLDALTLAIRSQMFPTGMGFGCPEPTEFAERVVAELAAKGFRIVAADGGAE